ncbi:hypothetical protein LSTR_LSTR016346 [Laodelphax striatellus]|uniref:Uncharacterized protein n=1 Tax=Laodelphax striatellus TaxID=195883 RepID=A0A482X023_LAOST|nr:hypothetical protein LSTR_LSTR016346 [Laodelphax striatellus]
MGGCFTGSPFGGREQVFLKAHTNLVDQKQTRANKAALAGLHQHEARQPYEGGVKVRTEEGKALRGGRRGGDR